MQINLSEAMNEHLQRIEYLAQEAAADQEESFASRASAMSALTTIIKELTKSQSEIINMDRLMKIEKVTIATLKEYLTEEQQEKFLSRLELMLEN